MDVTKPEQICDWQLCMENEEKKEEDLQEEWENDKEENERKGEIEALKELQERKKETRGKQRARGGRMMSNN